jgi:putative colanic acid biosynthesis UDP-glucose lipid carrier transferase
MLSEQALVQEYQAPLPVSFKSSLVDAAAVVLAYPLLMWLWPRPVILWEVSVVAVVTVLSLPGSLPFRGLAVDDVLRLAMRWGAILIVLGAVAAFAGPSWDTPQRGLEHFFLVAWGLVALLALVSVHLVSPWVARAADLLQKPRKVVIVGVNDVALRLAAALARGEAHGRQLCGYFDDRAPGRVPLPDAKLRIGNLADMGEYVKRNGVSYVYITLPISSSQRVVELLRQTQDTTASVYFVPNIAMRDVIQCRVALLGDVAMLAVCETPLNGAYGFLKRTLDVCLTLAAMPVLLPVMGVIAVLVRGTSEGPAIFKQRRYGLDGREITVWKFRTMTTQEDGCTTYRQATVSDERVTPIGRFLRRTSLDELPQFLNVLSGTMSIVGPRPHALAVNEQCRKLIPRYMLRHKVKPGITGWAQVNGHRGGDDLEALRKRTECDIQYLRSWTLGLDLVIIWKTALMMLTGDKNAY